MDTFDIRKYIIESKIANSRRALKEVELGKKNTKLDILKTLGYHEGEDGSYHIEDLVSNEDHIERALNLSNIGFTKEHTTDIHKNPIVIFTVPKNEIQEVSPRLTTESTKSLRALLRSPNEITFEQIGMIMVLADEASMNREAEEFLSGVVSKKQAKEYIEKLMNIIDGEEEPMKEDILTEAKTYAVNTSDDDFWDYQDTVNEYLMVPQDELVESSVNFESIAPILGKYGELLFEVQIAGIDDTTDGTESYYKITDPEALNQIAELYGEDENFYEVASAIQEGEVTGFMTFVFDYNDSFVIIPLESGFEVIEAQAKRFV